MYIGSLNFIRLLRVVISRFFESEPNDIYSHVSEKGSKGRFFCAKNLENHNIERKGKEKKKELGGRKEKKRKKGMVALLDL